MITADDEAWSADRLHAAVCNVAGRLADARDSKRRSLDAGDGRHTRISGDVPGAMRIGAIPVPVNFLARPEDFAYFLDDSYAVAAVVDHAFWRLSALRSLPDTVGSGPTCQVNRGCSRLQRETQVVAETVGVEQLRAPFAPGTRFVVTGSYPEIVTAKMLMASTHTWAESTTFPEQPPGRSNGSG